MTLMRALAMVALGVVAATVMGCANAPAGRGAAALAPSAPPAPRPIRVAIFQDTGASNSGDLVAKCLAAEPQRFIARMVTAADIQHGALDHIDVLVQGGGSGSRQAKALGAAGRANITQFVNHGGGYLGICAGAYLASSYYPWSLGIINTRVVDREHWARGMGDVLIRVNAEGRELLDIPNEVTVIHYGQGPLMAPADKPGLPPYTQLATFETEIHKNGAPEGVMKGTTALALARFGKGRVFCSSPHPERTPGEGYIVRAAVEWLAGERPLPTAAGSETVVAEQK